ncbi:MAG: peptide chain release factor 1 [Alphaproteobacteria bacterium]|jgi:peptide chain release factor 1|nr:peptide chain release factor 1 [Alphaproteobacteria bacterium]MDP6829346.1 peptide chain release factor 1 [Alphaproteobacteria bacterium]
MIGEEQIGGILKRLAELEATMAEGGASDDFVRLSKEYAELSPVAKTAQAVRDLRTEIADLGGMVADPDSDAEMRELATEEMAAARERLPELEAELQIAMLPRDAADTKNAILEVRAGTGGDEAALFAADLLRMYQRYAEINGWKFELMDVSESDLGGIRDAVASITGRGVFAKLKFESGVHRVQRVPETESQGRIHTSAATVAVLPEAEEIDVEVDPSDLRVDTYRAQGAGGQHVNKTDSAIRITHLPTGVVVQCQDNKSQHKNRAQAMKVLRARLYDAERQKMEGERASARKEQVGSGDRSERIRTYNFPQGRVTDHRINLTLYKLEKMMSGEAVDEVVDALIADHQASLLADLEDHG